MTTIAVGNRRLLRLAAILDKADALHKKRGEPTYDQDRIVHPCGTPACAWGHWAHDQRVNAKRKMEKWYDDNLAAVREFALALARDEDGEVIEAEELFGGFGCDNAETAKQAAKYIRAFVKRRSRK